MTTRHLVDPELLPGLDLMPPFALSLENLADVRAALEAAVATRPAPEGLAVRVEERVIAGGAGQPLTVLIYTPKTATSPLPGMLYIHGGGYVMGSAAMSDARCRIMADAVQAVIVSVDYRLAPETRHPGPLEDCYAALCWLHDQANALAIDPARVAVRGESAGAGLAAALALLARDSGGPPIRHQNLIYPMIDDRTGSTADPHPHTGEFVWTADANRFGWRAMLGTEPGGDGVSDYAAPARAGDLSGLPPAFIATGTLDLFVEEDIDYARRLIRAGVPTELHVYPGAYHGFEVNVDAAVTATAVRDAMAALRKALAP